MSQAEPLVPVKKTFQICLVVKDLQRTMEKFWSILGIGPWIVYTYAPPKLTGTTLHGKPQEYSMKLALATHGDVQWEIVEPLEGPSIYKEFLEEKGEGLHHVQFAVDDFDDAVKAFEENGMPVMMTGAFGGGSFAYMDTEGELNMIAELVRPRTGERPPPEQVYPPQD